MTDEYKEEPLFLPNTEGRTEFLPPDADKIPVIEKAVDITTQAYKDRPALDRTRELFGNMSPHKETLAGILEAARNPIATREIADKLSGLAGRKFTVYSPSNFCTMLETAGALNRVNSEGDAYQNVSLVPDIIEIEGESFYKPATAPEVYWVATEAGIALLDADNCKERIERLFAVEVEFLPIFKRILNLASAEAGTSMGILSGAVDSDPAVADNRRFYVQHFVEGLERAGALRWQNESWKTTDEGLWALKRLGSIEDNYEIPALDNAAEIPTTTEGVYW